MEDRRWACTTMKCGLKGFTFGRAGCPNSPRGRISLTRQDEAAKGIGPLRPTPAHSCFSFHDGMEIRGCGGIGRPTGSGWETEERFLGVEAFVMEGNGQVLVLKEGLVLKGYFSPLFCHIDLVAKTLTTSIDNLVSKGLSRLITVSVVIWSFLGSTHGLSPRNSI